MTKKLEALFDLPVHEYGNLDTDAVEPGNDIETNLPVFPDALVALDKIETALPAVKGLESSDVEMDELAKKATEEFDNLMNLGMQVDSRFASEIFAVASQMLGHAITAKNAKINKKLKMIDLQLKKLRMDRDANDGQDNEPPAIGQARVLDRNDLLRALADKRASKDSK